MFIKRDNGNSVKETVEYNTGMDAEKFLNAGIGKVKNMPEMAAKIKEYVENKKEKGLRPVINIIGDYDVDGIMGTYILYETFKGLGADVHTRLPHRFSEGYGLSVKIINEIKSGLVVTVDNGITAVDAIKEAKERGFTVFVIDHHLPNEKAGLPDADLIVDPHVFYEDGDFKDYCGAGLAYLLSKELFRGRDMPGLLVAASIATVADVVSLTGGNREIAKRGLEQINRAPGNMGLAELLAAMGLEDHITEDSYGYTVAPVFNASGRLYDDGAERALKLLVGNYRPGFPADMIETNNERKKLVKEALVVAKKQVKTNKKAIVVYVPGISEGIIGIIAGKICEDYKRPCIVFTDSSDGNILKGSGRSVPSVNLHDALAKTEEGGSVLKFGGHAAAAGLSVYRDRLEEFMEAFQTAVGKINVGKDTYYDIDLTRKNIKEVITELKKFAPYGEGNPKPLLRMRYDVTGFYKRIGDGSHLSVKGRQISLIGFGMAAKYERMGLPKSLDCIGYLNEDWYNGEMKYKFELVDFQEAKKEES